MRKYHNSVKIDWYAVVNDDFGEPMNECGDPDFSQEKTFSLGTCLRKDHQTDMIDRIDVRVKLGQLSPERMEECLNEEADAFPPAYRVEYDPQSNTIHIYTDRSDLWKEKLSLLRKATGYGKVKFLVVEVA